MYLPMAALAVIAVIGAYKLVMKLQNRLSLFSDGGVQRFFLVLLLLACLVLGALTHKRNQVYQSGIALWEDTVRKRPNNAKAQLNLGMAYFNTGKTDRAVVHFQEAIRLKPDNQEGYSNMGGALLKINRKAEALQYFEKGLSLKPDPKRAAWLHSNAGVALFELGRNEEAIGHFQRAIRLSPGQAEYYANLGTVLESVKRVDDAIEAWENALKIKPGLPGIQERLTAVRQKKRAGR